jgi:hypothetical protein
MEIEISLKIGFPYYFQLRSILRIYLIFFNIQEIEAIGTEDSKSTECIETTSDTTTADAPTLDEQVDASVVDQNVQG